MDAFLEEKMPAHMNTSEFFRELGNILNENGCVATNANIHTRNDFNRLIHALLKSFEANIFLAHNNTIENAQIIISGFQSTLMPIASRTQTIEKAKQLQMDSNLEFDFENLISLAYRGPIDSSMKNISK